MATYAVGDLQGCLEPLKKLLERVKFDPLNDRLWLVGDLINRGPESLNCLRFLYQMRDNIDCVLGNHDLHLIAIARGHRKPSRSDTLDEILNAPDCEELIHWLRHQPLIHHDAQLGYSMVHAGIPPQWSLDEARGYADEIQSVLHSDNLDEFLINMYGNTPAAWDKHLTGTDRWRCITNYFTRMRFCRADGTLNLEHKGSANDAPVGYAPWFTHAERKTRNDRIVFGHWAALEGKANTANVYALDTGCVWGGPLTMMRIDDLQFFEQRL